MNTEQPRHPLLMVLVLLSKPGMVEITDDGVIIWYGPDDDRRY